MIFTQVGIGNMPVNLILLLETAEVVFVVVRRFTAVFDVSTNGQDAYFDIDGFAIGGNEYSYNTPYAYKELPDMLEWLQQQNLTLN